MVFVDFAVNVDTGYPHDGRADKDSYPHALIFNKKIKIEFFVLFERQSM